MHGDPSGDWRACGMQDGAQSSMECNGGVVKWCLVITEAIMTWRNGGDVVLAWRRVNK